MSWLANATMCSLIHTDGLCVVCCSCRLRIGDIVGADVVLWNGHLSVDQSSITGESALKEFKHDDLIYAGSIVRRGEANAIVKAIGAHTNFGKTAKLVQSSQPSKHIDEILTKVVGVLVSIILVLITITLIIMGTRGEKLVESIPLLLMVLISALPVALPAMFTVSMALGSQELSKKKVLVTRLNVLEDAAMMSLLFSDKVKTKQQYGE